MSDLYNDPASVTGKAWAPLTIEGKTHKVYPLTFDDLGELQAWVNAQIPDPFDAVTSSPGFAFDCRSRRQKSTRSGWPSSWPPRGSENSTRRKRPNWSTRPMELRNFSS